LDGNQVVGFIISEIMTNSFGLDQSGWIKIIGVHPKHMGTGIGQSLIIQLFKQFKKKKINLHPTGEGRCELSACNP